MSWIKSHLLRRKYPDEISAITKLDQIFSENKGRNWEFTLDRLVDLVKPNSREKLIFILSELVKQHKVDQVFRVISPHTKGGIGDFRSLTEIPKKIPDWRDDYHEIEVTTERVKVLYKSPESYGHNTNCP